MTSARSYRAVAGAIAIFALVVQYWLLVSRAENGGALAATFIYVSYFTIITNWFGAAALILPVAAPTSAAGRFFIRPSVRTAAALYLSLVAIVYHTILAAQWDPQGWQLFTDIVFHTVTPAAVLVDWFLLTPKRDLRLSMIPGWLIVPVAFGAWTLARGAIVGTYPYPFLRVDELGYPAVLLNMIGLFAAFALAGAVMVTVGRRLPAPKTA